MINPLLNAKCRTDAKRKWGTGGLPQVLALEGPTAKPGLGGQPASVIQQNRIAAQPRRAVLRTANGEHAVTELEERSGL
jgi:hypothetical protein